MTRKAGSIVVDRLRDRIILGRYFGCWTPGDRLPSVRDVAESEDVDRKTAAAAYRQLQSEGLVDVEPRSGVYLAEARQEEAGDPLRRLHRQWLENTLSAALELGLDSATATRLIQAVMVVEERRIPVVDVDEDHAGLLARELCERTGLDCAGCHPTEVPAGAGPLRDAPFLVATPLAAASFRPYQRQLPTIPATLAPALLEAVRRRAEKGGVVVIVGTDGLGRELGRAVEYGLLGSGTRVRSMPPCSLEEAEALASGPEEVVVWPGSPPWLCARFNGNGSRAADRLLADTTIDAVRRQVARTAMELISTSSAAAPR